MSTAKHSLVAFLFDKRNRLISVGMNSYVKTHTLQAKYSRESGKPEKVFLHAEIDALLKSRHKKEKPHKVFVARYHKDGTPALAKPCPICMKALADFGVKIIEWTDS